MLVLFPKPLNNRCNNVHWDCFRCCTRCMERKAINGPFGSMHRREKSRVHFLVTQLDITVCSNIPFRKCHTPHSCCARLLWNELPFAFSWVYHAASNKYELERNFGNESLWFLCSHLEKCFSLLSPNALQYVQWESPRTFVLLIIRFTYNQVTVEVCDHKNCKAQVGCAHFLPKN